MGIGRAGDHHRVDTWVGERLGLVADSGAVAASQPLRRGLIGIDDDRKPRRGMGGDIGGMDRADTPAAELAETDHP
jgi:hypothetical protein